MKSTLRRPAAILLALAAAELGAGTLPAEKGDPPGLVRVAGGRVVVGTPREEIESMLPRSVAKFPLTAESPPQTVEIPGFWIQVNEVTNEQYEVFVRATNRRPPVHWVKGDFDEIQVEWLKANPGGRFNAGEWWDLEWEKRPWEVPAESRRVPVVYVSYADAQAYARWAGLRLPSREEFIRAGREDSTKPYPWGAKWETSLCANKESVAKKRAKGVLPPIGTHPTGKAPSGVYDLVGSVWEWTTNWNVEPKGYKPFEIKISGQPPEPVKTLFNSAERLVVGGGYATEGPDIGCRMTMRQGAPPETRDWEIGFRCARSEKPGVDVARWLVEKDLNLASLGDLSIEPGRVIALERWETAEGGAPYEASGNASTGRAGISASGAPIAAAPKAADEVAGYTVIRKYEAILLAPVAALPILTPTEFERVSRENPQPLALLYTDRPLVSPSLPPGLYTISYRHEGAVSKTPPKKEAGEAKQDPGEEKAAMGPSLDDVLSKFVDSKKRLLVFRDRMGEIVGAVETADDVQLKDVRPGAEVGTSTVDPEQDTIRYVFPVFYKLGEKKGFQVPITLKFEKGTGSLPWSG